MANKKEISLYEASRMRVGLFSYRANKNSAEQIRLLADCLLKWGFRLVVPRETAPFVADIENLSNNFEITDSPHPENLDAVISIGGDGTFLRSVIWPQTPGVPTIGVNTGNLGYLASFPINNPEAVANALLGRGCKSEKRNMLAVSCNDLDTGAVRPLALNEVAILKDDSSAMISTQVHVGRYLLANFIGDGLIVSTPTGSTGYNLSVGGPIMKPDIDAFVISPIAPHSLTFRPIVVNANERIVIKVASRSATCRVSLDGRSQALPSDTRITIRKNPRQATVVTRASDNFPHTLRNKLLWGKR